MYGVLEQQFRIYFQMAERARGITGEISSAVARATSGQHGLPNGVRDLEIRGEAIGSPRTLPGQRKGRSTFPPSLLKPGACR